MNFNGQIPGGGAGTFPSTYDFTGDVNVGGTLTISDGKQNKPSLAFESETTLGIYKSDDKTMAIVADGQTSMEITPTKTSIPSLSCSAQPYLYMRSDYTDNKTDIVFNPIFTTTYKEVGSSVIFRNTMDVIGFEFLETGRFQVDATLIYDTVSPSGKRILTLNYQDGETSPAILDKSDNYYVASVTASNHVSASMDVTVLPSYCILEAFADGGGFSFDISYQPVITINKTS
jgi:hypothetical protein